MKTIGIIPARYQSTRLPGKPLIKIAGVSMIERVYKQVQKADLDKVIVATDDTRVVEEVERFSGDAMLTSIAHESGTDRCVEVCEEFNGQFDAAINIQGDEPLIDPNVINQVKALLENKASIATAVCPIDSLEVLQSSHTIKVAVNKLGTANYFSRLPIPYQRGADFSDWLENGDYYQHIGIYGFQIETLLKIKEIPIGNWEKLEMLEQLRWLENGLQIKTCETNYKSVGVDTEEDIERVEELLNS